MLDPRQLVQNLGLLSSAMPPESTKPLMVPEGSNNRNSLLDTVKKMGKRSGAVPLSRPASGGTTAPAGSGGSGGVVPV